MKQLERNYNRIVIKIGSSLFYSANNTLDYTILHEVGTQIANLVKISKEVIVVSSGAIALGMHVLGLKVRPKELYNLQAAAAIGQNEVIDKYRNFFRSHGFHCGQVLLTWDDFNDRKRYLNAKNTLLALLKYHIVPIINENDTVATDEIKFGDNDQLSALVSSLVSADLLIILSDVDGLLDKDKKVIRRVVEITSQVKVLASFTDKKTSVGGMITKVEAAKIAMDSGIPCVIANGRRKNIISSLLREPEKYGTLFLPKKGFTERQRWIAFGTKPKGKIMVDEGAKRALLNKKSLLSVGVIGVIGDFTSGSTVSVIDTQKYEFARGKVGFSSSLLEKIKGSRYDKEVIHRDNIVILTR